MKINIQCDGPSTSAKVTVCDHISCIDITELVAGIEYRITRLGSEVCLRLVPESARVNLSADQIRTLGAIERCEKKHD